jgi:hypothetical protein
LVIYGVGGIWWPLASKLIPEAARRLGVATRVIVQAMYERKLPRVKLEDGTLGVPTEALDSFQVPSA